jgi:pyridoxal phosphate enzyme (YggS family)
MISADDDSIEARYTAQLTRLRQAAERAGRKPDQVKLIAVSKTHPPEAIRRLYALGQRDFGENYVQELTQKAEQLADLDELRWHVIGHLQSNKARAVVPFASVVQTVSSTKLVTELARRAAERRPATRGPLRVLCEVNLASEQAKSGCSADDLPALLDAVERESNLVLAGLMAIPPAVSDPDSSRPYFERLVELRDRLGGPTRLAELSMGMSHDAHVAVAAGATYVRIGTAIFGERG